MGLGDVRIADVIDSALETFRERLARGGIELVRQPGGAGALRGDAEQLRRVIINLVGNAIDALERERLLRTRASSSRSGENLAGSEVWVRVAGQRPRHRRGGAAEDLQPVLHLEGERHGARPRDLAASSSRRTAARSKRARSRAPARSSS